MYVLCISTYVCVYMTLLLLIIGFNIMHCAEIKDLFRCKVSLNDKF